MLFAGERNRPDVQERRKAFEEEVKGLDPEKLIFLDESGAKTNMCRLYGRAIGKATFQNAWKRV